MKTNIRLLLVAGVVLALATTVCAQDAASLKGTVHLRGGEQFSGVIKVAEMGVMDGTGIGTDLAKNGAIAVKTSSGATERIPAANIDTVEVSWEKVKQENVTRWQISKLTVTKRDGTQVSGVPNWFMHATSVAVEQEDGDVVRKHAYPHSEDFSPENLLTKIELTEAPAPAETTEDQPKAEQTKPEKTEAKETKPQDTKPADKETQPEPTTTEKSKQQKQPQTKKPKEKAGAPEASVEVTPQPEGKQKGHAPQISEVHTLPSQDVVITLKCPNCSENITMLLRVSALQGIASGASGVKIAPVEPAR